MSHPETVNSAAPSETNTPAAPPSPIPARRRWNLMDALFRLGAALNPVGDRHTRDQAREEQRKKRLRVKPSLFPFEERNGPSDAIVGNLVTMNLVHLGFEGTVPTRADEEAWLRALGTAPSPLGQAADRAAEGLSLPAPATPNGEDSGRRAGETEYAPSAWSVTGSPDLEEVAPGGMPSPAAGDPFPASNPGGSFGASDSGAALRTGGDVPAVGGADRPSVPPLPNPDATGQPPAASPTVPSGESAVASLDPTRIADEAPQPEPRSGATTADGPSTPGSTPATPEPRSVNSPPPAPVGPPGTSWPAPNRIELTDQPIRFVDDRGSDTHDFRAQGLGYGMWIGATGATLALRSATPNADGAADATGRSAVTDVVRLELAGDVRPATAEGVGAVGAKSNYFLGSDPSQWRTNVSHYSDVLYRGVYDGIDLHYYGTDGRQLEFDFVVAPGADPSVIGFDLHGVELARIEANGDLTLTTANGSLTQKAPVLYQEVDGARRTVEGHFVLTGDRLSFAVGDYDATQTLVIDPVLDYGSYLGGSGSDRAEDVAVDAEGYVTVAGVTSSSDFPEVDPLTGTGYAGYTTVFVSRFSPAGSLVFSSYLGGSGFSFLSSDGTSLALGGDGAIYLAGLTSAADFPTSVGAYDTALSGDADGFVTKLTAGGDAIAYSTYLGGSDEDTANAVAVDAEGRVWVTGGTMSSNFPTQNPLQATLKGDHDAFLTRLNADGTGLLYSTYLGGQTSAGGTVAAYRQESGLGLATRPGGGVVVVGYTQMTDFPLTPGAYYPTHGLRPDAFAAEFDADGRMTDATFLGGSGIDTAHAVAIDGYGQVVVVGTTASSNLPTVGGGQAYGGSGDAFVSVWRTFHQAPVYTTYLGGSGSEEGWAVTVDADRRVIVGGSTGSTNFPTVNASQGTAGGGGDGFVVRYGADSVSPDYATYWGGSGADSVNGVAASPGRIVLAGGTSSSGLPTQGSYSNSLSGSEDAFVGVLFSSTTTVTGSSGGSLLPVPGVASISNDTGVSAADLLTSDPTLSFTGTAIAGATVALYENKPDGRKLLLGSTTAGGGAWTVDYTGTALSEGVHSLVATTTIGGEFSNDSAPFLVTIDMTAPVVTLEAPENPYSLKPVVRVTATDSNPFATLTTVTLDVDLNNDGDFLDASESAFATAALLYGVAEIRLPTALAVGTVRFRARVTDKAGNEGASSTLSHTIPSRSSWSGTSRTPATRLDGAALTAFTGDASEWLPLDLDASPGTAMSDYAGLVYHSSTADAKPFVQVTLDTPNTASALPPQLIAYLTWDGVTTSQTYSLAGDYALGDALTVSLQPAANQSTGRHTWSLDLVADYASDPDVTTSYSGQTFVVNDNASGFGAGWSYGSTDRLVAVAAAGAYAAGMLRVKGTGGWVFYEQGAGVTYTNAAGETGTLISAGGGWELTTTEGVKLTFDSSGRQTKTLLANGVESFTYDYSGSQLTKVSTPDGAVATFVYASGLLSTIDAVGSRRVTVTHTGTDLSSFTNPVGNAYTFAYDANHRLTGETRGTRTRTWGYDATTKALGSAQEGSLTASTLTPALAAGRTTATYRVPTATTTDPTGGVWRDGFNAAGELVQSVDAVGAKSVWTRDGNGFVTAATDALGRTTTFTVDAAGYPTRIDYADGTYETFAYNAAQHAVTAHRDANGNLSTFTYDAGGQLLTSLDALNRTTTMTWSNGLLQTVTDPLNRTTSFTYDASRRLQTTVEPGNATTTLSYDATGELSTMVDPLGRTTTTVYDAWGRLTGAIDPLGNRGTLVYDAADQLTGSIDALGRRTSSVYDSAGRVTAVVEAVGTALERRTTFAYDAASRLVETQDALNRRSTMVYDAAGRVVETLDALWNATAFAYDAAGQVIATMDARGRVSRFAYDSVGWMESMTDAIGNRTTLVYDGNGNLTATVDALGRRTTSVYDAVDRLVEVIDALNQRATLVYDAADQLIATVDPRGNRTTFVYDARGRMTEMVDALNKTSTMVYDAASRPVATVDPLGNRTTFVYDAADRLTEQLDALGRRTTFVYDAAGQMTATVDALNQRSTFVYDALGRLEATIDALNQRSTLVYDAADQVIVTIDALGRRTTSLYDANGRPTETIDALGHHSYAAYDAVGDLVATRRLEAGTASGTRTPLDRGQLYRYDALGRLVESTDALRQTSTMVYDAVGNLVAAVDPLGKRTTMVYDALNRVEATVDMLGNRATLVYDAAGNVTEQITPRGNRTTYVYDALNRVSEAVDPLGNRSTLVYDAAGNLQATIDPRGNRTTYVYDALNRVEATRDALNQRTTLVYDEVGRLVATVDALGRRNTAVYDAIGRLTETVDALNQRTTLVYDAVGNVTVGIDELGRRTTMTYDALDRMTVLQDALGNRTTSVYDAAGQLTERTDARGFSGVAYYDALGRRVPYIDPVGNRADSGYDAAGNRVRAVDEVGNVTTHVYDALNRLEATVDPFGNRTTLLYDADSNLQATIDALGRRTTYSYDAAGRPESVQDALGNRTTATYDAAGNLIAAQDARGNRTTVSYDALNRPEAVRDALNGVATAVYDAVGNVVASIDQLGRRTTLSYDALNRVESVLDAMSNRTTLAYDAAGNLTEVTDALNQRTTYHYDALNRRDAVRNPLGDRTTVVYDAVGNAVAVVDALGRRTTSTYDAVNRLVAVTDALGGIVTTTYVAGAKTVTVDDARGHRTTMTYDKLNRPLATTDPLGHTVTQVYDAVGNVVRTVDALNFSTTYSYDALNRMVGVTKPSGGTWTTGYDAVGNAVTSTDPLGHTSTVVYDALNRAVEVVDALSGTTTTVYDAVGNATGVVDAVGNRTTFVYDALNRVTEEIDPLNKSITYAYDAISRMTGMTNRVGQRQEFAYDAASRLTSEVWKSNANATVNLKTFTYDAVGNLLTARDAGGAYTMTYDALNRVSTVKEPFAASLTFSYDANGNRTRMEDSFGRVVTSVYDAAERLTSRTTAAGMTAVQASWEYTARDQLATVTYSTGGTVDGNSVRTYDSSGRLTNLTQRDGADTAYTNTTYAYDIADRLTSETTNGAARTYTYDVTDQLTADSTSTYTYDLNGNRTSGGYTTGAANRVSNDGVWTYTYDDEGRRTKKSKGAALETWTYEYDHDGRLTRVEQFSSDGGTRLSRVDYTLDAWGNRIARKEYDGSLTLVGEERYAVDGWEGGGFTVWADLNGSNALVTRRLTDLAGDPLGRISSANAVTWYARDRLGSVTNILNASGTVAATVTYDGFGNVLSNSAPSVTDRYGYVGRELDSDTGLLHFGGGRELALDVGRYLTEGGSGDPNPTRYLRNGWPNPGAAGSAGPGANYVGAMTIQGKAGSTVLEAEEEAEASDGVGSVSTVGAAGRRKIRGGYIVTIPEAGGGRRPWLCVIPWTGSDPGFGEVWWEGEGYDPSVAIRRAKPGTFSTLDAPSSAGGSGAGGLVEARATATDFASVDGGGSGSGSASAVGSAGSSSSGMLLDDATRTGSVSENWITQADAGVNEELATVLPNVLTVGDESAGAGGFVLYAETDGGGSAVSVDWSEILNARAGNVGSYWITEADSGEGGELARVYPNVLNLDGSRREENTSVLYGDSVAVDGKSVTAKIRYFWKWGRSGADLFLGKLVDKDGKKLVQHGKYYVPLELVEKVVESGEVGSPWMDDQNAITRWFEENDIYQPLEAKVARQQKARDMERIAKEQAQRAMGSMPLFDIFPPVQHQWIAEEAIAEYAGADFGSVYGRTPWRDTIDWLIQFNTNAIEYIGIAQGINGIASLIGGDDLIKLGQGAKVRPPFKAPTAPKTWQDFLPEAEARLGASKAKYGDGAMAMARPPRITARWTPRDVTNPKFADGCESVALQIQKLQGGEIKRIVPQSGPFLGGYRGHSPGWYHHEVVVKDGRVYDLFTGHEGLPIAEYKKLWEYADNINFGF